MQLHFWSRHSWKIQGLALLLSASTVLAAPLDAVNSFMYQLQGIDPEQIAASSFDLAVIDYSADGTDEQAFSAEQVALMKTGGRLVVSYFSIGEAEDYRFYFKQRWLDDPPSWLDRPNPNWVGNYKVRYWERAWKRILKRYLDKIIEAGFDGIYLDIIDAFEYRKFARELGSKKKTAKRMAKLVLHLAEHARVTRAKPNFIVIPQNGAGIIDKLSETDLANYFATIDAIGAEDTFYFGDLDEDNELNPQTFTIDLLTRFRDAGKPVIAIDYLTDPDKIEEFRSLACEAGFLPQVGLRALDSFDAQVLFGCN